jgi:hypothetical protein
MPLSFRKSSSDRKIDVDAVVHKLKSLYKKYAQEYSSKIFNLQAFEQRYHDALVNKININNFCHAEITVFEELKKRVLQQDKPRSTATYSDVADRIIEENLRKIRKYHPIDFHPDAEEETKYLLGVVTDFYYSSWGTIKRVLTPLGVSSLRDFMGKLENDFSYFVVPMHGLYSRAVDDYLLVLSRKNSKDNEKASYNFMKYGAILLNNCLKLIGDGLNFMRTRKEYRGSVEELTKLRENLLRIIADFRLSEIKMY